MLCCGVSLAHPRLEQTPVVGLAALVLVVLAPELEGAWVPPRTHHSERLKYLWLLGMFVARASAGPYDLEI